MIYTCAELENKLGGFSQIRTAVKNGKYFKISHGLYSDKNPFLSELENIFVRYPSAVLTLQSAFSFYNLSDFIPDKYYVATNQNAHRIKNDKVEQIFITNELLNIGRTTIKTKYGFVNIYDLERMLIELFRLKSRLSYSYFKEVVNSYRQLFKEEKIDSNKLSDYCALFKNGKSIMKQIQDVIIWKQ